MRNHLRLILAPASVLLLGFAWHAGTAIDPKHFDFGPVLIKAKDGYSIHEFKIEVSPGPAPGTTLKLAITGAGQKDYFVTPSTIDLHGPYAYSLQGVGVPSVAPLKTCSAGATAQSSWSCEVMVVFQPHADGISQAELVASDSRGGQATASLMGNGVDEAPCDSPPKVVSCNFGYLYSGSFNWSFTLKSPDSRTEMVVSVGVNDGVAWCDGSETITDHGNTNKGAIKGPGLFAVEWVEDSAYTWAYKITAACPTPDYPAGRNGEAATPSQPANLSGNVQETPPMPDRATQKDWSMQKAISWLRVLEGNYTTPAPETDPVNSISGSLTHSWKLSRK